MAERTVIAALVYSAGMDPAPVLADVARTLQSRGVPIVGVIQHGGSACAMELEVLPHGRRMSISQNLGSGASGCRLDTSAMAEAASLVRAAIDNAPLLAIFNKFGAQEAAGAGLRSEMIAAQCAGVPMLTAVKEDLVDQWTQFTGCDSAQLPCSPEAALAWWESLTTI